VGILLLHYRSPKAPGRTAAELPDREGQEAIGDTATGAAQPSPLAPADQRKTTNAELDFVHDRLWANRRYRILVVGEPRVVDDASSTACDAGERQRAVSSAPEEGTL
jgi:hypothetical protein